MELIFPVIGRRKVFRKLFQVPLVVGTVVIDAFVDTKVLPVLDRLERMPTVRALEFQRGCHFFTVDKSLLADLTFELPTSAAVIVDILMWGTAERADDLCGDIMGLALLGLDRFNWFAIPESVVFVPELPVLFDEWFDDGQFIGKELLVFRAMELVMGPLFERDVSADKKNEPAELLVLALNDVK